MKTWTKPVMLLMVTMLAALLVRDAMSQKPPEPRLNHPHGVAVINLADVFKGYERFTAAIARLKVEVTETQEKMENEGAKIVAMKKKLEELAVGSDAYNELDETVTQLKSDFITQATKYKKHFSTREADIYHRGFVEIGKAIEQYAQNNNISIVVRAKEKIDNPRDRDELMKTMNQAVVYHSQIDISAPILAEINKKDANDPFSKVAAATFAR